MRSLLVVTVLVVLGGCGNDTSTKGKANKPDVVAAANAVCKADDANQKASLAAYETRFGADTPSQDEAHDFLVTDLLPKLDATVADMHRIPLPLNDRAKWDKALSALDDELKAAKDASAADPVHVLAALKSGFAAPTTSNAGNLFIDFGATDCTTL
jgi:hypothetical protein